MCSISRYRTIAVFPLILTYILLSAYPLSSATTSSYQLSIRVTGLKSTKGQLLISVFTNQDQFKKEKPIKVYTVSKQNVKSGTISTYISLPPGTYGIALLDDANSNKKMDYRGPMPLEGFGFGDYYHSGLTRPTFSDFSFQLKKDQKLVAKMRYL